MANELSNTHRAGRLMRLQGWIVLVLTLLTSVFVGIPIIVERIHIAVGFFVSIVVWLVFSWALLKVGAALKQHRRRTLSAVLALLSILMFPIGTVIGGAALVYTVRGWNEPSPAA